MKQFDKKLNIDVLIFEYTANVTNCELYIDFSETKNAIALLEKAFETLANDVKQYTEICNYNINCCIDTYKCCNNEIAFIYNALCEIAQSNTLTINTY